jgi:hypothetical protein
VNKLFNTITPMSSLVDKIDSQFSKKDLELRGGEIVKIMDSALKVNTLPQSVIKYLTHRKRILILFISMKYNDQQIVKLHLLQLTLNPLLVLIKTYRSIKIGLSSDFIQ